MGLCKCEEILFVACIYWHPFRHRWDWWVMNWTNKPRCCHERWQQNKSCRCSISIRKSWIINIFTTSGAVQVVCEWVAIVLARGSMSVRERELVIAQSAIDRWKLTTRGFHTPGELGSARFSRVPRAPSYVAITHRGGGRLFTLSSMERCPKWGAFLWKNLAEPQFTTRERAVRQFRENRVRYKLRVYDARCLRRVATSD